MLHPTCWFHHKLKVDFLLTQQKLYFLFYFTTLKLDMYLTFDLKTNYHNMHTYYVYTCIIHTDGPCSIYVRVYMRMIHTAPTVGVASLQWEWHPYSGSGISTVGVAPLEWEWHLYSGSGSSTAGVVSLQWEWYLYSGSGISTVGVVSLQWEWHLYSGSGISIVGVASL